jgi:hypothetical protein
VPRWSPRHATPAEVENIPPDPCRERGTRGSPREVWVTPSPVTHHRHQRILTVIQLHRTDAIPRGDGGEVGENPTLYVERAHRLCEREQSLVVGRSCAHMELGRRREADEVVLLLWSGPHWQEPSEGVQDLPVVLHRGAKLLLEALPASDGPDEAQGTAEGAGHQFPQEQVARGNW